MSNFSQICLICINFILIAILFERYILAPVKELRDTGKELTKSERFILNFGDWVVNIGALSLVVLVASSVIFFAAYWIKFILS